MPCRIIMAFGLVLVVLASARGQEGKGPETGILSSSQMAESGGERWGHVHFCPVYQDGQPVALFAINKRPGEKERYVYLLLFKCPPGKKMGMNVSGKGRNGNDTLEDEASTELYGKKIEATYKYTADPKTHALTSETVTVGGKEVKKDDPRVFLVDLTKDKVEYAPVKVDLPKSVPVLHEKEKDTWAPTVMKAVAELKEKSPEVKKFYQPDGK